MFYCFVLCCIINLIHINTLIKKWLYLPFIALFYCFIYSFISEPFRLNCRNVHEMKENTGIDSTWENIKKIRKIESTTVFKLSHTNQIHNSLLTQWTKCFQFFLERIGLFSCLWKYTWKFKNSMENIKINTQQSLSEQSA